MTEFDQIASAAWEKQKTPLERMYDIWTSGTWEPDPPQTYYRIWDRHGIAFECDLCENQDRWQLEGLESQRKATVFVCDHGIQICGPQVAIRKIRSIPVERVSRYEKVSEPAG